MFPVDEIGADKMAPALVSMIRMPRAPLMKYVVFAVIIDESVGIIHVVPSGCDVELGSVQLIHSTTRVALLNIVHGDVAPIAIFIVIGYDDGRGTAFEIKNIP